MAHLPDQRTQRWVIRGLVASCLISVLACSLFAWLSVSYMNSEQTRTQRHSAFCSYLATQLVAVSLHAQLTPLEPGLRSAYITEGCP